jgi:alkylhydroperoxidase/carboxymuconolactone decarboxylase family protein YurZ
MQDSCVDFANDTFSCANCPVACYYPQLLASDNLALYIIKKSRRVIMASIKMIDEENATGNVKKIYSEIKASLGIDFVPNMYKVMAHKPHYLETTWNKTKAIMHDKKGKLDSLTKEIIAVAVSATMGCEY